MMVGFFTNIVQHFVQFLAELFGIKPEKIRPEEIRQYQSPLPDRSEQRKTPLAISTYNPVISTIEDAAFQIIVKNLSALGDRIIFFDVLSFYAIDKLKSIVYCKERLSLNEPHCLTFRGKELENGCMLSEYVITTGSTLCFTKKVRIGRPLSVINLVGKKVPFDYEHSYTIYDIKCKVQANEGILTYQ
jgi:hypothetical protein